MTSVLVPKSVPFSKATAPSGNALSSLPLASCLLPFAFTRKRRGLADRGTRPALRLARLCLAVVLAGGAATAHGQELYWTSWGAARTVSGSMHVLQWRDVNILLECGTYFSDEAAVQPAEGESVESLNTTLPLDVGKLDLAILSHAHLDHSGRLPLLARSGWRGPIYATPGTIALARHMLGMPLRYGPLPAETLLRKRGTRMWHSRAHCRKLEKSSGLDRTRTTRQAASAAGQFMCSECVQDELEALLLQFVPLEYGKWLELRPGLRLRFQDAGHIAGASVTELEFEGRRRVVYSGDLGGQVELLVSTPRSPEQADTVVVEATYGDGVRSVPLPPYSDFEAALRSAAAQDEPVVVVAYTLDRTQRVLYLMRRLQARGELPADWPVTMPSPSAQVATEIYERLLRVFGGRYFAPGVVRFAKASGNPFRPPRLDVKDSGQRRGLFLIPAGLEFSKTGQRILARMAADPRAHIFSVGYADAESIVGRILAGKQPVIEGRSVEVRARVRKFSVFSGHADSDEIVGWLRGVKGLRRVLVVHGEPASTEALAAKIREQLGVTALVPEKGQRLALQD
jgi:metallo-beta-lactamase family protein